MTEDEMVGWNYQLGHEFEQAPGVGDGREAWRAVVHGVCKELDMTEQLNWYIHTHIYAHMFKC